MEFSAIQIAKFLSGTIEGNPEVKVYNVAKIDEYLEHFLEEE